MSEDERNERRHERISEDDEQSRRMCTFGRKKGRKMRRERRSREQLLSKTREQDEVTERLLSDKRETRLWPRKRISEKRSNLRGIESTKATQNQVFMWIKLRRKQKTTHGPTCTSTHSNNPGD